MQKLFLIIIILFKSLSAFADERSESVDFFILFDTSLSMEPVIQDARLFAAENVIAPLIMPGDWLSIVTFFGSSKILVEQDIVSESDKVDVIKKLKILKADGVYTDIGSALDTLDALVRKRAHPERPKYILLITDERQEAPKDTKYYSASFKISHPLLEYVKKVGRNGYSVITIGYGISAQVDAFAQTIFQTLSDPPPRPLEILPGATPAQAASVSQSQGQGSSQDGQPENTPTAQGERIDSVATQGSFSVKEIAVAAIAGTAIVLIVAFVVVIRRKAKKKEEPK